MPMINLEDQLRQVLIPLEEPADSHSQPKSAAVLVPLLNRVSANTKAPQANEAGGEEWQVILTRRARHLKHHAGQISFPGGRYEPEDQTLATTAIRETHEETGIEPDRIKLIGRLPQHNTISRYNVTPFVGIINHDFTLNIDENEVCEIFEVPLRHVLNPQHHQIISDEINGQSYQFHLIRYNAYNIWGATARILVNLSRRINLNHSLF